MTEETQGGRVWWLLKVLAGIVTAAGLALTGWQAWEAKQQYVESSRQSRYDDILAGLSTTASPATQIDSIFRLVEFVGDKDNFASGAARRASGGDLQQTLVMYIKSTARSTSDGIKPYRSGDIGTTLASIAFRKLQILVDDPAFHAFAISGIDLDDVDLHGFHQSGLSMRSSVSLVGADLREAQLENIQVRSSLDLEQADLTCADLNGADVRHRASLGRADLKYADLTGADLTFLDLSHVQNLKPAQVRHAVYDSTTRWPTGFVPPPGDPLTRVPHLCTYLVNRMTGMLPGEGYSSAEPWPASSDTRSGALAVSAVRDGCTIPSVTDVPAQAMRDPTAASARLLVRSCG